MPKLWRDATKKRLEEEEEEEEGLQPNEMDILLNRLKPGESRHQEKSLRLRRENQRHDDKKMIFFGNMIKLIVLIQTHVCYTQKKNWRMRISKAIKIERHLEIWQINL